MQFGKYNICTKLILRKRLRFAFMYLASMVRNAVRNLNLKCSATLRITACTRCLHYSEERRQENTTGKSQNALYLIQVVKTGRCTCTVSVQQPHNHSHSDYLHKTISLRVVSWGFSVSVPFLQCDCLTLHTTNRPSPSFRPTFVHTDK